MDRREAIQRGLFEKMRFKSAIEDVDLKNKIVTGYWAGYNNKDYGDDVIRHGSAAKSIRERGPQGSNEIFFLRSHDWDQPLGRPTFLEERERGLYHETPVVSGATFAEDALKLMAAGLMIENSIGFVSINEKWVKPNGEWDDSAYREITELKLYEGSAVVLGMNPETPFTGFKSMTMEEMNDQISKMMKVLRNGDLTDEGFARLEIGMKMLQRDAFELGKKSLAKPEPDNTTQKQDEPIDFDKAYNQYLLS